MSQPLHGSRFLASFTNVHQIGPSRVEVAFVGRSNVGKSSLLNALTHRKQLARVSNTPGRTRLINVFGASDDAWLVDLPGYGYAKAPKEDRVAWRRMIEGYLTRRPTLRMVFVIVDAEVGPTPLDVEMVEWLESKSLPFHVVANKADKVKSSHRVLQQRAVAKTLLCDVDDISWVSTTKGTGVLELRKQVAHLLEVE